MQISDGFISLQHSRVVFFTDVEILTFVHECVLPPAPYSSPVPPLCPGELWSDRWETVVAPFSPPLSPREHLTEPPAHKNTQKQMLAWIRRWKWLHGYTQVDVLPSDWVGRWLDWWSSGIIWVHPCLDVRRRWADPTYSITQKNKQTLLLIESVCFISALSRN